MRTQWESLWCLTHDLYMDGENPCQCHNGCRVETDGKTIQHCNGLMIEESRSSYPVFESIYRCQGCNLKVRVIWD